ncbi:MAG: efflux RND transporter periplasmic adaptor subunit [Gemmatimonadota bacterium]|jgi:Cu(I)/Ag(I) efflux system membrane fusion protein
MNTKKQMVLSAVIVVAAAGLVAFKMGTGQEAKAQGGMSGHNHAAMTAGADEQKPVRLDEEGARRIGVTYAAVQREVLPVFVKTVGTVAYDETRLATVNPKIAGWVEKLYVDFTGAPVKKGQPLMDLYSPALVSAQEELVLAARLVGQAGEGRALENARELLRSARRRLSYWDIPDEEIARIEHSGEPTKTLTLRAPASGVVVEKNVVEGDRIMPGMTVYRIADLSRVWIEADVFEKDLALVKTGQGALVSFEAYPGKVFKGRVTYVYPTVSVQARTARVRLELPNPGESLKPGMYAQIDLDVPQGRPTLVVPRSAVLATGERAIVFVRSDDGTLVPREVVMGRTSGRLQELLDGVEAGEQVVSSAAFLVDAESNLGSMAMPGMDMGAPGGEDDMQGMDMSAPGGDDMQGMDHSGHDMDTMGTGADSASAGMSGTSGHRGHGG